MFKGWARNYPWKLILSMMFLTIIGILFIYSATYYDAGAFARKQLFWASAGIVVFFITGHLSYRSFMSASYLIYALAILSLLAVYFIGDVRFGAQRWIQIGPLAFQPSEFAKLATLIALANFLGSYHQWESSRKIILIAVAIGMVPMILIMKQPDLGTSLIFIPMLLAVLFLWGIPYRFLVFSALGGIAAVPLFWNILKEYQRKRIMVFLNPDLDPLGAGYTAIQARIAVGSGGWWGKGFMQGTQGQLEFVPEHHTDFIFCVLGEEWGFMGSLFLLLCYFVLFKSIFQVMFSTTDMKARLLAAGICSVLFFQIFVNIGMSIGITPITGLTLPLISYGGSSFIVTCFALGLVLSIHRERSIF